MQYHILFILCDIPKVKKQFTVSPTSQSDRHVRGGEPSTYSVFAEHKGIRTKSAGLWPAQ